MRNVTSGIVPPAMPGLLPVADALDHAGVAQHVVGHALAPLAAGLGAGEGLAQVAGGLGERSGGGLRLLEAGEHRAVLRGAVAVEPGHHVAEPLHLGHQPVDALLEGVAAQVEQAGAARHRVAQLLARQLGGHVGGRAHGVLALHAEAGLELGGLLGEQGRLLLEGGGDPLVGGLPAGTGGTGADHVGEHEDGGRHDGESGTRAMVGMGRVCTGGVTATADPQVRAVRGSRRARDERQTGSVGSPR